MGVITGARATIFTTDDKGKKTVKKKEQQQTSNRTRKQTESRATKAYVSEVLSTGSQKPKEVAKKEEGTHETSQKITSKKTVNTSNKNSNMIFSLKKKQKGQQKHRTKGKQQDIGYAMPKQWV